MYLPLSLRHVLPSIVGVAQCLAGMDALTQLSLCNVGLKSLTGFPSLAKLTRLNLADNKIKEGLHCLPDAPLPSLRELSLAHNRIEDIHEMQPLQRLDLTHLDLCDCPVCEHAENYREHVFETLPTLQVLDNLSKDGIDLINSTDDEEESSSEEEDEEDDDDDEGDADDIDDEVKQIEINAACMSR